ncbi:E3 SUMO-protein ligase KIAA1586 [Anabarilius grahami]|uniref:E3 SUMO-protein ligase KIAA1586 n=1 Tax=Anabarilius grahami TaxID=495550 RepID=A0A3N0YL91_ANAGA|nr:E3 SUMO-protein ligase KIAA1586 [Anabarilius grahami]
MVNAPATFGMKCTVEQNRAGDEGAAEDFEKERGEEESGQEKEAPDFEQERGEESGQEKEAPDFEQDRGTGKGSSVEGVREDLPDCGNTSQYDYFTKIVLEIRWVASSFRTVKAVWTMYAALYNHLTAASRDVRRNSSERRMYDGLAAKLSSVAFVKNFGLMMDALEELKNLSEALQARYITLSHSVNLIKRQLDVFNSMSRNPDSGPFYKTACVAAQQGVFNGITLQSDSGQKIVDPTMFYKALCKSMETRMVTNEEE